MDNPYQAPNAELQPRQNYVALKYVGFWARLGAYIIDTIILMLIMTPIAFFFLDGSAGLSGLDPAAIQSGTANLGTMLAFNLLPILIIIAFWMIKGTTPGKMVFKGKIVDAKTGGRPSKWQCVGRYFGYIISTIPLGLGFLWIAWDKRKQGWHDKMSGTVVVSPSNDPDLQISFDS